MERCKTLSERETSSTDSEKHSGKASRAEMLRDIISVCTMYHDDLDELEDMQEWVCLIATRKARQAQRAKKQAKQNQEFLQRWQNTVR